MPVRKERQRIEQTRRERFISDLESIITPKYIFKKIYVKVFAKRSVKAGLSEEKAI